MDQPPPATANGPCPMPSGVYVPMLAFFDHPDQEVDIGATQRHAARLIHAGVTGLLIHGSNGEAVHLSRTERTDIIKAVVDTVRHEHDRPDPFPVIAGCSAQSVHETVELCREAANAGATHVLILPPSYYAGLLGREGILEYFRAVAGTSPIPVLIYNFPQAVAGIDLSSDEITELARQKKIVGVKLTCGNTGKLARLVDATSQIRSDFAVFGGSADFILQGAVVGAAGTISGLANLCPLACAEILKLYNEGDLEGARAIQAIVAHADWLAIQYGFVGVKAALGMFEFETGASVKLPSERDHPMPRLPCKPLGHEEVQRICAGMKSAAKLERRLVQGDFQSLV